MLTEPASYRSYNHGKVGSERIQKRLERAFPRQNGQVNQRADAS